MAPLLTKSAQAASKDSVSDDPGGRMCREPWGRGRPHSPFVSAIKRPVLVPVSKDSKTYKQKSLYQLSCMNVSLPLLKAHDPEHMYVNVLYLYLIYKDRTSVFDLSDKSIWRGQSFHNRKSKGILGIKDVSSVLLFWFGHLNSQKAASGVLNDVIHET